VAANIPPFLIVRQGFAARTNNGLMFNNLNVDGFDLKGVKAMLRQVILCNSGHFKTALPLDLEQWLVHNGMHGWCIGRSNDKGFAKWFQGRQYSISLILYELVPHSDGTPTPEVNDESRNTIVYKVDALARRVLLEKLSLSWTKQHWTFDELEDGACMLVLSRCKSENLRLMKNRYTDDEWKKFHGLRKKIVSQCDKMLLLSIVNDDDITNRRRREKEEEKRIEMITKRIMEKIEMEQPKRIRK